MVCIDASLSMSDSFKDEIKALMVDFNEKDGCPNTVGVYRNLFKPPVKRVFSWTEEAYSGQLCIIFQHKEVFMLLTGAFGSCSHCDTWEDATDEEIHENRERTFRNIEYFSSLDSVRFSQYDHPDLKKAFKAFNPDAGSRPSAV